MSAQLQDLPVGHKPGHDLDDEIRKGVLAAVMHVAAAGMPSTRELALEFVAANEAIVQGANRSPRTCALLGRALAQGLSIDSLKQMALERRCASELLDVMRRGAHVVQHNGHGKAAVNEYCKVVVDAAERAARTDIGAAFPTHRPTHAQRVAIEQIRSALMSRTQRGASRAAISSCDGVKIAGRVPRGEQEARRPHQ